MSIGKQFLERLSEAKKPVAAKAEAPKPTFVADAGTERMKAMMRDTPDNMHQDLADHIAEMANAAGVPGAFLNKTEIRKAFIQSAIKLKNMPTRLKYFRILHTELTQLRIGNLPSSGGGGITMKKGAEDEKAIVGTAIQELLAEILVDLGVPMEYFTKEAPTPLKTSLKRAGTLIMSNSAVKNAIKALARGEGIRSGDDTVGSKKPGMKVKVQEAGEAVQPTRTKRELQATNDTNHAGHAIALVKALGLPVNDMFVRKMNMPTEQAKLNKLISRNQALKAALRAYAAAQ